MEINVAIADILRKIAEKINKTPQDKQITTTDFYEVNNISITSTMADRLSTLVVGDSDVQITGSNRAETDLKSVIDKFFYTQLKTSVYTSLGTGDCLLVPVTDGNVFSIDIIDNNSFVIFENIGDTIYSVGIKRDEVTINSIVYSRWDYMGVEIINGSKCSVIKRYAFKGSNTSGTEVPLNAVNKWADIEQETIIPNVDKLLIGRIKCPTTNRQNINSVQGVPVTYGLSTVVEEVKKSYLRFNEEYRRKQTKIFARKDLFTKDTDKGIVIPDTAIYQMLTGDLDGELPIKEFSPDLRYEGLKGGVDFNLKMLELLSGFSPGVMTPIESSLATATEIKASQNPTFAFVNIMRKIIESGVNDLVYAMAMIMNRNSNNGVIGSYAVGYDWDDSIMENSTERFQQLLQAKGVGELEDGELMAWTKNIPLDQAKAIMSEMETVPLVE